MTETSSGSLGDLPVQRCVANSFQPSFSATHFTAISLQGGWTPLGRVRIALSEAAQRSGDLVLDNEPKFLWVTEFPLFTRADEDKEFLAHGRWSSSHHPFTAPMHEDIGKLHNGQIEEVRGQHYDLVLNGVEVGGGSVRVHDATMQEYIFQEVLQVRRYIPGA